MHIYLRIIPSRSAEGEERRWSVLCGIKSIVFPAGLSGGHRFVQDLKEDERGLSGVVVAVLLILVAVLAVVMIWGFLGDWLDTLFGQIEGKAGGIA